MERGSLFTLMITAALAIVDAKTVAGVRGGIECAPCTLVAGFMRTLHVLAARVTGAYGRTYRRGDSGLHVCIIAAGNRGGPLQPAKGAPRSREPRLGRPEMHRVRAAV